MFFPRVSSIFSAHRAYLILSIAFFYILLCPCNSFSAEQPPVSITAQVFSEKTPSGTRPIIALNITVKDGYYVYAHDENHGRPLSVRAAFSGTTQSEIYYPQGIERKDIFDTNVHIRALDKEFRVFVCPRPIRDGTVPTSANISVSMLACSKTHCVPFNTRFDVSLSDVNTLPPIVSEISALHDLHCAVSDTKSTPIYRTNIEDTWHFSPRYVESSVEPRSLGYAILFGILAGLLLNFMPCVLPVLTLKIVSLLGGTAQNDDYAYRVQSFRKYAIAFSAGIITWFGFLGVGLVSAGMLWGGLFRSSALVLGLAALIFLLAISFFDVFYLPMFGIRFNQTTSSFKEAFISGLLVTLLATPCSGPLLGGVLAWSVMQFPFIQGIIFIFVGIGMAIPYIFIALFPNTARFIPRSGAWTAKVAKIAGILLIGTSVYLISILPDSQWGAAALTMLGVLLTAFALGKWASLSASSLQRYIAWCVGCLFIILCITFTVHMPIKADGSSQLNLQTFRSHLGKQNILIEFTADWCPSCKILERTTLSQKNTAWLKMRYDAKILRIDMTQPNDEADELLRALGSISIPFVALFPQGELSANPVVLRDLFTSTQLKRAAKFAWDSPSLPFIRQ